MDTAVIYPAGITDACHIAGRLLEQAGAYIADHPMPEITHLLLDVPLRQKDLSVLLSMLPEHITVVGGKLNQPLLQNYPVWDLLEDPYYLAQNAAITAECAVQVALPKLKATVRGMHILILGWGRIGKCLAQLLRSMGATVTIAARKDTDRAMIRALGYRDTDYTSLPALLPDIHLLYNTVPYPILNKETLALCRNAVKIELASVNGMDGSDILIARGLPGIYAPEASGKLIADTFIRFRKEEQS